MSGFDAKNPADIRLAVLIGLVVLGAFLRLIVPIPGVGDLKEMLWPDDAPLLAFLLSPYFFLAAWALYMRGKNPEDFKPLTHGVVFSVCLPILTMLLFSGLEIKHEEFPLVWLLLPVFQIAFAFGIYYWSRKNSAKKSLF